MDHFAEMLNGMLREELKRVARETGKKPGALVAIAAKNYRAAKDALHPEPDSKPTIFIVK